MCSSLFLAKCFHSKCWKVFLLGYLGLGKQDPKKVTGSWICSLPQSYISSRLGQCHIVILILELFFFSTTVLLMCPCLNWIYLENVHRVYLYFRASRISDTTFGSHVVRDLAINTSINYGLASAKIFSLVCFLYPNIKQIRLNHVDCVGNMVRTDAVGS